MSSRACSVNVIYSIGPTQSQRTFLYPSNAPPLLPNRISTLRQSPEESNPGMPAGHVGESPGSSTQAQTADILDQPPAVIAKRGTHSIMPRIAVTSIATFLMLAAGPLCDALMAQDLICRADIDLDGDVDGGDLARLLGTWGPCGASSSHWRPQRRRCDGRTGPLDRPRGWGPLQLPAHPCPRANGSKPGRSARPTQSRASSSTSLTGTSHDDWPLIVALHGFGSNGDGGMEQLERLTGNGIPRLVADDAWPVTESTAEMPSSSSHLRTAAPPVMSRRTSMRS